ncbi:MAG: hypothetical protein AB1529_05260 [Candidatus Micrarchaeota archaeon]
METHAGQEGLVVHKEQAGGGLFWFACIIIALLIIHFSCQAGTATGYVGGICQNGLSLVDFAGLLCCAPLYLLVIVVLSGGLRIW